MSEENEVVLTFKDSQGAECVVGDVVCTPVGTRLYLARIVDIASEDAKRCQIEFLPTDDDYFERQTRSNKIGVFRRGSESIVKCADWEA